MDSDKDNIGVDVIKLPNNLSSMLLSNKYLISILVTFYMNTRNVNVNESFNYVYNSSKEQKESLLSQLNDYLSGKNIQFDILGDSSETLENAFKIPNIKINNQAIKPVFLKKIIKQNENQRNKDKKDILIEDNQDLELDDEKSDNDLLEDLLDNMNKLY